MIEEDREKRGLPLGAVFALRLACAAAAAAQREATAEGVSGGQRSRTAVSREEPSREQKPRHDGHNPSVAAREASVLVVPNVHVVL